MTLNLASTLPTASLGEGVLLSLSRPCPVVDMLDVLRRAHGERRVYWANNRQPLSFVGFGALFTLHASGSERMAVLTQQARTLFDGWQRLGDVPDDVRPRLFGGLAFRADVTPTDVWSAFDAAAFMLPRVLVTRRGDDTWLTLNAYVPRALAHDAPHALAHEFDELYEALFWDVGGTRWNPEWEEASAIEYPMSYDTWAHNIQAATAEMQTGTLQKVVLARMCQVRFSRPINVARALTFLGQHYPETTRFLIEPQPHSVFYGATPETLVALQGGTVHADALAGSIRRGVDAAEDDALAAQLQADPKECHEHALVVDGLRARLGAFVHTLNIPAAPTVLRLSNIQHLYTPVEGRLRAPAHILDLVRALHPTPALGGSPYERAQQVIAALEPITRGWYAGPVGWLDDRGEGIFAVAIRSAVSEHGRVWLYAGAGIVPNSTPEREWRETQLKFRPMLNALGIAHARAES